MAVPTGSAATDRRRLVENARTAWVRDLLEPDALRGMIPAGSRAIADLGAARSEGFDALLAGRPTALRALLNGHADPRLSRIRAVHRDAAQHRDALGLPTVHLVHGIAWWSDADGAGHAPAVIRPAHLTPTSPDHGDFELSLLPGGWELNPLLVAALRRGFSVSIDPSELDALLGGPLDSARRVGEACAWLARRAAAVPGFLIEDRVALTTLSIASVAAAEHLLGRTEALVGSDLVAAVAGDMPASEAIARAGRDVEVSLDAPDRANPADEHLVADADASQHYAVNAALAGRSLAVVGAPGTGKSRTVANIVSAFGARGKSVLLVAHERSAIDTVARRLRSAGLDDFVAELDPLESNGLLGDTGPPAAPDDDEPSAAYRALVEARKRARAAALAPHEPRPPWGLSLYEIQNELLELPSSAATDVRFSGSVLSGLVPEVVEARVRDLVRYAELVRDEPERSSAWSGADVRSRQRAQDALRLVDELRSSLPAARAAIGQACAECRLPEPSTFGRWWERLELWRDLQAEADRVSMEIYQEDVDGLRRDLMRAPQSGVGRAMAGLFSGVYKSARGRVRELVGDGTDPELLDRLEVVARNIERWRGLGGEGRPTIPADPAALDADATRLSIGIDELSRLLAKGDEITDGSPDDLQDLLDRLHEDRATPLAGPEREELRRSLAAAGLDGLAAEVDGGVRDPSAVRAMTRHAWLSSLRDVIRFSDRQLGKPVGADAERAIAEFRERDRAHMDTAGVRARRHRDRWLASRLARPADQARPAAGGGEPDDFAADGGGPACWAISPLRVGELPEGHRFDLVIVEGADRVGSAEVVAALASAPQAVLFGDSRPAGSRADGSLMATLGSRLERVELTTHYRSASAGLFSFTNHRRYDGEIETYPSPEPATPVHIERADASGVVAAVIGRIETHPDESLVVLATGRRQAQLLDEAVRGALARRPELQAALADDGPEAFVVKSVEHARGDERDAVILVIGDDPGVLADPNGEEVLHVALTRARRRLIVLCEDPSGPAAEHAPGVDALRLFMSWIEDAAEPAEYEAPAGDAFEADVARTLREAGLPVAARVGGSPRPVDLAVAHPERPGEWVLAIEGDGPGLLASATARERERLRRDELERRGWSYLRVRSGDWCDDPGAVARRVVSDWRRAVEAADRRRDSVPVRVPSAGPGHEPSAPALVEAVSGAPPRLAGDAGSRHGECPATPGEKITKYSSDQLDAVVAWVASDGAARNEDEFLTAVMDALAFKRRGSRIVATIEKAIDRYRESAST